MGPDDIRNVLLDQQLVIELLLSQLGYNDNLAGVWPLKTDKLGIAHMVGSKVAVDPATKVTETGSGYVVTGSVYTTSPFAVVYGDLSNYPTEKEVLLQLIQQLEAAERSSSPDGNMNNAFRVLFDTRGGSFISPVTYLSYGDRVTEPPAPAKECCTFAGWYTDEECTKAWSFSTGIPGDLTLYAKWTSAAAVTGTVPAAAQSSSTATAVTASSGQQSPETAEPAPVTTETVPAATTKAPVPAAGLLFGLLAAGVLLRRRE
jgi:uncharacterized repeat protein (TIGR02543 family)